MLRRPATTRLLKARRDAEGGSKQSNRFLMGVSVDTFLASKPPVTLTTPDPEPEREPQFVITDADVDVHKWMAVQTKMQAEGTLTPETLKAITEEIVRCLRVDEPGVNSKRNVDRDNPTPERVAEMQGLETRLVAVLAEGTIVSAALVCAALATSRSLTNRC